MRIKLFTLLLFYLYSIVFLCEAIAINNIGSESRNSVQEKSTKIELLGDLPKTGTKSAFGYPISVFIYSSKYLEIYIDKSVDYALFLKVSNSRGGVIYQQTIDQDLKFLKIPIGDLVEEEYRIDFVLKGNLSIYGMFSTKI